MWQDVEVSKKAEQYSEKCREVTLAAGLYSDFPRQTHENDYCSSPFICKISLQCSFDYIKVDKFDYGMNTFLCLVQQTLWDVVQMGWDGWTEMDLFHKVKGHI